MKFPSLLTSAVCGLALAGGALACIESLDLEKMMSKTDACVRGTITDVQAVRSTIDDTDWARIFTVVTVEGEDLYTGQPRTLEMAFMGGTHQGETELVSSMPAVSDYRIGNKVVAFSAPIASWGESVGRCLYATYGGLYREVQTRKGPVVLGKGADFAIENNVRIADLKASIAAIQKANKETK
jgi:hypothetical protein